MVIEKFSFATAAAALWASGRLDHAPLLFGAAVDLLLGTLFLTASANTPAPG